MDYGPYLQVFPVVPTIELTTRFTFQLHITTAFSILIEFPAERHARAPWQKCFIEFASIPARCDPVIPPGKTPPAGN